MPQLFLSYSHRDNDVPDDVKHEHRTPISRFVSFYTRISPGSVDLFFDTESLQAGQSITESIKRAIADCEVMIAFYSPNYFASRPCLEEWLEYRAAELDAPGEKLLIPVEVRSVDIDDLVLINEEPSLADDIVAWYSDVASTRWRTISSAVLLDPDDTRPLDREVRKLRHRISRKQTPGASPKESAAQHDPQVAVLHDRSATRGVEVAEHVDEHGDADRARTASPAPERAHPSQSSSDSTPRDVRTDATTTAGTSISHYKTNVHAVRAKIVGSTLATADIQHEIGQQAPARRYPRQAPVCVVYTGGTVGLVQRQDSDPIHPDYELPDGVDLIARHLLPRLSQLPFDMQFFALDAPIDSADVGSSDWVSLASLLSEQMDNYQGFVILHGANTLAYTASALSFLLNDVITKPVIVTGAEVPLAVLNSDAPHNIENAIRAAAWDAYSGPIPIPEVCVYWSDTLHRGNRVTKKYASDRRAAFHTPNMLRPLGVLTDEGLTVSYDEIRHPVLRAEGTPQRRISLEDVRVGIMFIYPGMDSTELDRAHPADLDGLILLSYGSGDMPSDQSFLAWIKARIAVGTAIVNITQCPYGRVDLKVFETGVSWLDVGVVDGYDMTVEAAYTKLLWALAQFPRPRAPGVLPHVRRIVQANIAGEMSATIHTVEATSFAPAHVPGYVLSDLVSLGPATERTDIVEVFLRVEGLRIPPEMTTARVRILLGQPANDVELEEFPRNLLAEFNRTRGSERSEAACVDKNVEVTHAFRKCFVPHEPFQLAIGIAGVDRVELSALRLVAYTRATSG